MNIAPKSWSEVAFFASLLLGLGFPLPSILAQSPAADAHAKEFDRVARAQEHHDADGLVALADEYEARWKRGERGEHIPKALDKLVTAVNTWEWADSRKQMQLPIQIGLFVLENAAADAPLDIQVDMACCITLSPDQHKPSFTAAERKRRALLASQVLQRVLAKVDPTIDVSTPILLNVSPPDGVPHAMSGMSPDGIKDPALRAEYERRIRARDSLISKRNEQLYYLNLKPGLLLCFERYLIAAYSSDPNHSYSPGPAARPELDKILADLKASAKGNSPDVDAMVERVARRVRASVAGTRPAS